MSSHPFQATVMMPRTNGKGFAPDRYKSCMDHQIKEDAIEYFDGVFSASCVKCGDGIEIDRIPGGQLAIRARSLLKIVNDGTSDPVHRMELSVLKSILRSDIESVKETAGILVEIEEKL